MGKAVVSPLIAVVDTDTSRVVGISPQGVTDVSYFPTSSTEPPAGAEPVLAGYDANGDLASLLNEDGSVALSVPSAKLSVIAPNVASFGAGAIDKSKYARTSAALARVKNKTGYMKYGVVTDSTGAGAYSLGSGTAAAGNRPVSPIEYLAAALNSVDYPALADSFVGDSNVYTIWSTTIAQYDPRITLGSANWSSGSVACAGGKYVQNATDTASLTFLPLNLCDTFEVYYAQNTTSLGQFTISRSGDTTSPAILSQQAAQGVGKYTFNGALGKTALSIQRNGTGGSIYIGAVDAYNSNLKSIRCFNIGWSGSTLSDALTNVQGFDPLPFLLALQLDTVELRYGINEWNSSVPVATFKTNLTAMVNALLPTTDVILATPYPSQNSTIPLATQQLYVNAIYEVAATFGLAVNDLWRKVGTWERGNAFGYYANALHPQQALYRLSGESSAKMLMQLV